MIRRVVGKLARMNAEEIVWRTTTAGRILRDRIGAAMSPPRWVRTSLRPALAVDDALSEVRAALKQQRWSEAHRALSRHFARAPRRFPIAAASRGALVDRIHEDIPDAAADAVRRADRILGGDYDLLGYRGLRFSASEASSTLPDWHLDCVHGRRPPQTFWSTVPYLDSACGDHKIIWELNRHQHWIALGRAFWLTG